MIHKAYYRFLYVLCRIILFFAHPIFLVKGRENVPRDGKIVICSNHRSLTDPVWVILGLKMGRMPAVMAKKEAMSYPVLGSFLRTLGVFGVDRSGADVHAFKTGIKCLRDNQALLIFPEGTRVKPGKHVEAKGGALLLAARAGSRVLPVYISTNRLPFGILRCIIGEPYDLQFSGSKPTDEEIRRHTQILMKKIYSMGEKQ